MESIWLKIWVGGCVELADEWSDGWMDLSGYVCILMKGKRGKIDEWRNHVNVVWWWNCNEMNNNGL